jgi:metal-responsive CopG/Arc/MetJ family transcriptional regulator
MGGAYYLESSMKTIHVALDARLLQATDRAARHANLSRSALIRNVLNEHLRTLEIHRLEEQDRKGHPLRPQENNELSAWERAAVWPR